MDSGLDFELSPEDSAFRAEVLAFIKAELPPELARKIALGQWHTRDEEIAWERKLGQKGWLAYNWSREDGGPGFTPMQKFIFWTALGEMSCPTIAPFGPKMVGPVINSFGSPEQKAQHLPGILSGETRWCQGYSEPGAGSDLAALQTKAERKTDPVKGDVYVINGSKIWTSYAHWADWMFALVRTSKEPKRQQGISFLLIDMKTPGIRIDPIIAMDGYHGFNQVFFDDVEVPVANRVGEEGKGWTYAKYLLGHERLEVTYLDVTNRLMATLRRVAAEAEAEEGEPLPQALRMSIAEADIRFRGLKAMVLEEMRGAEAGAAPGPEVSALKIIGTELQQQVLELITEVAGWYALPYDFAALKGDDPASFPGPDFAVGATARYLNRRSATIFGGSTEIQKGILAKNVLGL